MRIIILLFIVFFSINSISKADLRPIAEYEKMKYVVLSDDLEIVEFTKNTDHSENNLDDLGNENEPIKKIIDISEIKFSIAKSLPSNVTLIITTKNISKKSELIKLFSKYTSNKIDVLEIGDKTKTETNTILWSRDITPITIFDDGEFLFSNAKDSHYVNANEKFANLFNIRNKKTDLFFEGGNFLSDSKGKCFIIENALEKIFSDKEMNYVFGCRKVIRLPFVNGIGHIDERVKFLSDKIAVTDTQAYVKKLENEGFTVTLLPLRSGLESYVNSLIINGNILMPTFGDALDNKAAEIYTKLGFIVKQISGVKELANIGNGSVHCITANFPDLTDNKTYAEIKIRPFAEFEKVKYLIISAEENKNIENDTFKIKSQIVKNLPKDITLILMNRTNSERSFLEEYKKIIPKNIKYKIIESDRVRDTTFWARDIVPYPVITNKGFTLTNTHNALRVDVSQEFQQFFGTGTEYNQWMYQTGNFLADTNGLCFFEDKYEITKMPNENLSEKYGCKKVIKMPDSQEGINHIDEKVKIIKNKVALTNNSVYAKILENEGYKIVMFPKAKGFYNTYLNALQINETMFVPIFGDTENDNKAISIYKSLGFKVIAINVGDVPSQANGSIHCMTMTYPEIL